MNQTEDVLRPILIQGWPAWLRPDGTVMHVIAGGAPDEGDAGGDGGGSGDGGGDEGGDGADPTAELAKWKSIARENEKRAKANAEAAKRLQEIEDSQKSELDKLTEAKTVAERRANEAEQRALRLEVAADKGLTPAQAKRLVGATKEDLEADADELLASFKPADDGDGGAETDSLRRPRERLRPGATPSAEPEETDPRKLVAGLRSY